MELVCPHCHNNVDMGEGPAPEEVICTACGSSFRLEPVTTTDWSARDSLRTLGKYELIETVGSGAFGTVYMARDPDLGRTVAIKVPRAGNLAGKGELDRFVREAKSAAQLRHPFIVSVHEVGEWSADGVSSPVPYLVSEFVGGVTLADQLSARRPGPREAAELIARLADALQYAHEMGVVHRDVKPANVMLSDDGTPRLMDFGLAKRDTGDVTVTIEGQVLGTPAYMSPEQARGEAHRVDGRSDVYSLGVILYQLLTGELPFRGTPRMLLHQVLHDDPRRPRSLSDRIPRDLETICLKAMAKETSRRDQTARELADDLRRFLKGEPVHARPISALERGINWVKRRPAMAGLLVVSGVAVVSLGAVATGIVYNTQLEGALQETEKQREKSEQEKVKAEAATKEAERNKYLLHIAQAHAGWREGKLLGVEKLLDVCPIDQRNWEWYYLKRLCHAHSIVFKTVDPLISLAFSPDGRRLAFGGFDKTVRILDLATQKEIGNPLKHSADVAGVEFSLDGERLSSTYFDGTIKVWEVATGREIWTQRPGSRVVWIAVFSPDGTRLASASEDRTVRIWDAKTGQSVGPVLDHPSQCWGVAFSPDGRYLATGGDDKEIRLYELATSRVVRAFNRFGTGSYSPVAFSPDGRLIASADGDGTLKVWEVATGVLEHELIGHKSVVWSVTFSPDGRRLASSGIDQTAWVWDLASGRRLITLKGHISEVSRVAFHPDGSWLASVEAVPGSRILAWPVTANLESRVFQGRGSLAYSPDGSRLVTPGRGDTVAIWDAETGQELHTLDYQLLGPPSPGSRFLEHSPVVYSKDDSRIAAGARDGSVFLWDAHTCRPLQTRKLHTQGVSALAISPDGTRIASSEESFGKDATILIWEAGTGRVLHTLPGHTDSIGSLAFSPDGRRLASGSMDSTVRLWDTATGEPLDKLTEHFSWVCGVAFSPDGKHLASGGNDDVAFTWDLETRKVQRLDHASMVWQVSFSADSKRLACCCDDGTVKIWEVERGQETITLPGPTRVRSISFSPDGTHLAAGSWEGTIRIWDARPWTDEAADEARLEREALGRLDFLFSMPLRKTDVVNYLKKAVGITSQVQRKSLEFVERYREETNPERYHEASWAVMRQPYLNAFQYRFAVQQAEAACELAPGHSKYVTALGAAQYRAGQFQEALKSLTKAQQFHAANTASLVAVGTPAFMALAQVAELQQTTAVNLAFLAMAYHRLGQAEQAGAALARLRESLQSGRWNKDEEAQMLLREAEAVIAAKAKPDK